MQIFDDRFQVSNEYDSLHATHTTEFHLNGPNSQETQQPNNPSPYIHVVLMTDYCNNLLLATEWRQQVAPKRWHQPTYYIHADRHRHTHYVHQPTALHCPVDDASSQNCRRYNFIAVKIGLHFMSVIYKAPPSTPTSSILNFILS